jgi:RimJ/RimL family protein N-acetyltransferase
VTAPLRAPESLETQRLILRKISMEDADSIFASYAADPAVTRFLSWPTHRTIEDTVDFLTYAVAAWEEGSEFVWTIQPKGFEALVGTISFGRRDHRAHLGYVIARSEWGKGYMTEAARALVEWVFQEPEIQRVEAICDGDNQASRRVLEKAGLELEGTLRKWMVLPNLSNTPRDVLMFSKVR